MKLEEVTWSLWTFSYLMVRVRVGMWCEEGQAM